MDPVFYHLLSMYKALSLTFNTYLQNVVIYHLEVQYENLK